VAQSKSNVPPLMYAALGHYQAGALGEARALVEQVLRLDSLRPDALHLLGLISCAQGDTKKGIQLIRRAIAFSPRDHEAFSNLGIVLQGLGRDVEALDSFDKALAIRPDSVAALNNRGSTLQTLGRFEEALACFDKALAINPRHAPSLSNRGNTLRFLGRFREALADFGVALSAEPDSAEAHWNESMCLLATGDFRRGWKGYEWRWRVRTFVGVRRTFPVPLWLGREDLAGKTVLLHAEQGFGDTLQFCRYAPEVAAFGARVILALPQPLKELLRSLPGVAAIQGEGDALPPIDFHCPLMSLPLAFGTELESIPAQVPYLTCDPGLAALWRERLGQYGGLKVGLVWAGRRWDRFNERRSVPLERMLALSAVEGVTLVSLQKGEPGDQALGERARAALVNWTSELADFADTAALVSELDLVITIDTSVAHLTGALGKPVWVVNRFEHCWRWLRDRNDSPWYPTMRLFTQSSPGDWGAVMAHVAKALTDLAAARRNASPLPVRATKDRDP
jgi:Flp pilus assembly protein TadD